MADPAAPPLPDLHGPLPTPRRRNRTAGLLLAAAAGIAVLGVGFVRTAGGLAGAGTDVAIGGGRSSEPAHCAAPAFAAPSAPSAASAASAPCASPLTPAVSAPGGSAGPAPAPSSPTPSATPGPPAPGPSVQPLAVRLQAALDRMRVKLGIPGVSVTILLPDGSSWTGVSGVADVADRTPVTPETAFAFASVSKTFTSALILQLIDEGRLRLSDPAVNLLPPLRLRIDRRITVGMLLNHTSGLADFFLNPKIDGPLQRQPSATWTADRTLRYVGKPLSPPGSAWHYSNTNYLLLGLIAERITGRPLGEAIRTRLLEPAGLGATWDQVTEAARTSLAHGYRFASTKLSAKPIDLDDRSGVAPFRSVVTAGGGAGAMAGTSSDLARWGRALYSGSVLGPQGTAILLSGFSKTTNYLPGVAYGYGIQAFSIDGHPSLGHSGRFLGFRSVVRHFPIDGLTIAVLTNQSRADPGRIVRALLTVAVPPAAPVPPETPDGPACRMCLMAR